MVVYYNLYAYILWSTHLWLRFYEPSDWLAAKPRRNRQGLGTGLASRCIDCRVVIACSQKQCWRSCYLSTRSSYIWTWWSRRLQPVCVAPSSRGVLWGSISVQGGGWNGVNVSAVDHNDSRRSLQALATTSRVSWSNSLMRVKTAVRMLAFWRETGVRDEGGRWRWIG